MRASPTPKRLLSPILWNTGGSVYYFACQWLLTVVVARFDGGFGNVGTLTLAVSLTNLFSAFALFAVRHYQVSDIDSKFSDAEYGAHRLLTCTLSLLACTLFVWFNPYNAYEVCAILLYLCLKLCEAFADYLHGILQKQWRMDYVGISYLLRGTCTVGAFFPVFFVTKNLCYALLACVCANLLALLLFDLRLVCHRVPLRTPLRKGALRALSFACLPLLCYSLAVNTVPTVSRYFLDRWHGEDALGIYGSATTLAVVVQAVTSFLFNPLVGVMAEAHKRQDKKKLRLLIGAVVTATVLFTALALLCCRIGGTWVTVRLMGEKMRPHVYLLDAAVLASCITGLIWFFGTFLTVLRAYRSMIFGAVLGLLTALICAVRWIDVPVIKDAYSGVTRTNITALSVIALFYLLRCASYLIARPHLPDSTAEQKGKRILVVCQHFYPESFRINDLCDGFVEAGMEVDVLCGHPNYPTGQWFAGYNGHNRKKEEYHGMHLRRVFEIKRGNNSSVRIFVNYMTFPLASLFHLPALLTKSYDRVFIYSLSPVYMGIAGILYGKIKQVPIITYVMDLWPENLYSVQPHKNRLLCALLEKSSTWFYRKSDKLIVLSQKAKELLLVRTKKEEKDFLVLPQCCEKLYETPLYDAELQARYANQNTLVYCGNLSPAQDFPTLIEAASLLEERNIPFHLLIVGDGMSKKEVEAEVAKRGLSHRFTFTGQVPMEQIPKYTAVATALVALLKKSPLLDCTIPAKVMSYIAAGKPLVLAMDGEAQALVQEHGIGYAGPSQDAVALAEHLQAVCALSTEERAAMGQRAKDLHFSRFERNINLQTLRTFLCEL